MEFEWDKAKERRTLAQRGIDFDFASRVFGDHHRIDRPDTRRDYGEDRRQIVGQVDGRIIFVVYTIRGRFVRIISARKAHDKEQREYRDALGATPTD